MSYDVVVRYAAPWLKDMGLVRLENDHNVFFIVFCRDHPERCLSFSAYVLFIVFVVFFVLAIVALPGFIVVPASCVVFSAYLVYGCPYVF